MPVTSARHATALTQGVLHSHLVATACELERPADGAASLAIRLDGIAPGVAARTADALELFGSGAEALDEAPSWWGTDPGRPGDVLLKLTHETASLTALLDAVDEAAARWAVPVDVRGSVAVGTVSAALRSSHERAATVSVVDQLRSAATTFGGTVVVLDADPETQRMLDVWGPVRGLDLMRRVKEQFDPDRVLSPGRFVGGI